MAEPGTGESLPSSSVNYDGTVSDVAKVDQEPGKTPLKLTEADIRPEIPEAGGTDLIVQVNARDNRDKESPEFGSLMPEAEQKTFETSKKFFDGIFAGLNPEERDSVDVIVFASDAPLRMPGGVENSHQRALETAQKVLEGAGASMTANGVDVKSHLLNKTMASDGGALPIPEWVDLEMWDEPEFVDYLQKLWGSEFWSKYESNWLSEISVEDVPAKVELPVQIASRTSRVMDGLTTFARQYHEAHPGRRLIIWADGMYDNISPWVKRDVLQQDPAESFLPIEKGGGLTVKVSPDGKEATTKIGSQDYAVPSLYEKPKE